MLSNTTSTETPDTLYSKDNTLAVLAFSQEASDRSVALKLETIQDETGVSNNIVELWKSDSPITNKGLSNQCQWRCSKNFMFVSKSLHCSRDDDIQSIAQQTYRMILKTIKESDYQHLVRFWNIIPRINVGTGDSENYKRFCDGRLTAFQEFKIKEQEYPAASAVGHHGDGITVYAIASKLEHGHIGNPRQVEAFNYPRQYGRSSPSFARATYVKLSESSRLFFVSGTASILGHDSVHIGDLKGQLHTTNDNILYLLKEAGFKRINIESLRVYLRNPRDFAQTKEIVESWYPNANVVITHADICRSDLLVEIECFCIAENS